MGLFSDEVRAEYAGRKIAVNLISASNGYSLKLYIDGQVVDSLGGTMFLPNKTTHLRGRIEEAGNVHVVEVHTTGFFSKRLHIFVDDVNISLLSKKPATPRALEDPAI